MKIHYRIKNNAIEIVRCYGTDDRIVLPEEINGLPVVSAAPYAFSAHKDGEEDAETWESEDVISFGEERLLAGEEVQEIVFPDTLKEIGRYIFYGCKKLERLEFSDTLMQVGTGAFTGCSGLKELVIHQKKGLKSCAKEILGELWQKIDVDFLYENGEAGGKRAHMVFPEHYDEAVENTPARILFTEYHGSGTNYRAKLFCLSVESPDEIDIRRAQEAKERAEEQLRQKQSIQEYHMNQMALARAMTRLKVTHKQ